MSNPQLIEDLTDHLLAKIESLSEPTVKLDRLMEDVWPDPDLKELQKLANIYTNPKMYLMKKVAVLIGLFASTVFLAGAVFKFLHLPGTSQLTMMGYLLIGLFVLPYFWWKQYHYALIDGVKSLGKGFNLWMCLSGFVASEFMLVGVYVTIFIHAQPLGLNLCLISAFFLLFYVPMYWFRQYKLWSVG